MSIIDAKITQVIKNIQDLPTVIRGRADWLKQQFDAAPEQLRQAHNLLIDELQKPAAAASLGAVIPENSGLPAGTPGTVQGVLDAMQAQASGALAQHAARTDNPHGVTAAQAGAYTKAETDAAINQKVVEIGAADMTKAVYDPSGRAEDIFAVADGLAEEQNAQAGKVQIFSCTLFADGWIGEDDIYTDGAPVYTQTASCPGLLAAYDLEAPQVPSTGVQETDAALKEGLDALCEAGNSGEVLAGQLKWTCYGSPPTVDLPLRLRRAAVKSAPEGGGSSESGGQEGGSDENSGENGGQGGGSENGGEEA